MNDAIIKEEKQEESSSFWQKIKSGTKPGKDQFVICILIGLLLLIVVVPTSEKTKEKTTESVLMDSKSSKIEKSSQSETLMEDTNIEKIENAEEYERYIENKLEQAIAVMEGAGKVKVMVTVNTSRELVVAKDMPVVRSNTTEQDAQGGSRTVNEMESGEETVYRKDSDGSSSPYVVKTRQPLIEGVVVVAQGGNREEVKANITEAIEALFDIEPNKIKIVKMKSE